jgi:hypothetical protein
MKLKALKIREMKNITEHKAREITNNLNEHFNTDCNLKVRKWLRYGMEGCYQPFEKCIYLTPKSLQRWVVIHEFAHHLCRQDYLPIQSFKKKTSIAW